MQSKQRWVGAGAVLVVVAVIGAAVVHRVPSPVHSFSGDLSGSMADSTEQKEVVYDLPLAGQIVKPVEEAPRAGELSTEDAFATTSAELRVKAAQTTQVTAHILRTKTFVSQESESKLDESVETSAHESASRERIPEAWVVQLAAVGNPEQAQAMAAALRSMGWLAYTRVTDVFVGPYIDRHKADALKEQLQKKMHLQGVIKKFTV